MFLGKFKSVKVIACGFMIVATASVCQLNAASTQTTFKEDVTWAWNKIKNVCPQSPVAAPKGLAIGGVLSGLGAAAMLFKWAVVPSVQPGMTAEQMLEIINSRTSFVKSIGQIGLACTAAFGARELIEQASNDQSPSNEKKLGLGLAGICSGVVSLALIGNLLGYKVVKAN